MRALTNRILTRLTSVVTGGLLLLPNHLVAAPLIPTTSTSHVSHANGYISQDATALLPLSSVERELKGGETHFYRVSLAEGQFLHALVEQKGVDVAVVSFSPSGQQLTSVDSPNDQWGTEPVLLVAETSGDYRVVVRSPNSKAPTGSYEIKIVSLREASDADKRHVAAEKAFEEGQMLRSQQKADSRRAAIEKYKQALPLFRAAGDTYRQAITLLAIGFAHAQLSESRQSLDYFDETLSLARTLRDRRLEAATETFLGGMHDALGNVKKALDHFNRGLALSRESGNRAAEASTLNNIGAIYRDIDEWQNALRYFVEALSLFRTLRDQRREATILTNIGTAYDMLGEQGKSLEYFQQSLPLRREAKDKNGEAETLSNIGYAYYKQSDQSKAIEFYNHALSLQREVGNRGYEAITLDRIGMAHSAMGQPEKALGFHQQALEIQRATGNLRRQGITISNVGHVHNLLNQTDQAFDHYSQALSIFNQIGDTHSAAVALQGIARAERRRGNLIEAKRRVEESLALVEQRRAGVGSQHLRATYFATMQEAYELNVDVLMQLHRERPTEGFDAEGLRTSERARARSLIEMLTEARIDILRGAGADLIVRERELVHLLNAKAQRYLQSIAQKSTREQIDTLAREVSEVESQHQQVQAEIRRSIPNYAALTQPAALGLKEIQEVLDQDTLLLEYLLGKERSYLWVVSQGSLRSYELPKREAIEKAAREVYGLLTARGQYVSMETRQQAQQRVVIAERQLGEAARRLSNMVLGPAVQEFRSKRLVVVADGALQYVPFGMLPVPENFPEGLADPAHGKARAGRPRSPDTGLPLIVEHEVVSLPSASTIAVQRKWLAGRHSAPKLIAIFADPVFETADARVKSAASKTGQQTLADATPTRLLEHIAGSSGGGMRIPRLPFTRQEADHILSTEPQRNVLKALDFRASRALAMSPELSHYRYVHFATHGYLDSERPGLSAIVLSMVDEKGQAIDGFLRANDIYNLKLPAEVVVLSACQTGLGKEIKGEGLVGLTRGFMYAGAARVVVSLWNVNDKATAELMTKFYEKMLRQGERPAAALRAAQVEMWKQKQWHSPYFWAAFTMQGEWR